MLDMKYVEENVLTNTDRFLEEHITGSFRTWHVILIASTVLTVTGVERSFPKAANSCAGLVGYSDRAYSDNWLE